MFDDMDTTIVAVYVGIFLGVIICLVACRCCQYYYLSRNEDRNRNWPHNFEPSSASCSDDDHHHHNDGVGGCSIEEGDGGIGCQGFPADCGRAPELCRIPMVVVEEPHRAPPLYSSASVPNLAALSPQHSSMSPPPAYSRGNHIESRSSSSDLHLLTPADDSLGHRQRACSMPNMLQPPPYCHGPPKYELVHDSHSPHSLRQHLSQGVLSRTQL